MTFLGMFGVAETGDGWDGVLEKERGMGGDGVNRGGCLVTACPVACDEGGGHLVRTTGIVAALGSVVDVLVWVFEKI